MLTPTQDVQSWDERRNIVVPGDSQKTLRFCIEHFIDAYKKAMQKHGAFYVALSGGSTPKAIFASLSKPPFVSEIDWSKVHLFWSDERSVPPTDPDSNFHMAMEAGFSRLPILPEHVHRMHAEEKIEENALAYEKLLQSTLPNGRFDLLMLGMGEDGHTASLFPGAEGPGSESDKLVIAHYVPQKNTYRMSVTFKCINASSSVVLYVLGASKQEILKKVFSKGNTPPYPVEKVGTEANKALWIVDRAAALSLFRA